MPFKVVCSHLLPTRSDHLLVVVLTFAGADGADGAIQVAHNSLEIIYESSFCLLERPKRRFGTERHIVISQIHLLLLFFQQQVLPRHLCLFLQFDPRLLRLLLQLFSRLLLRLHSSLLHLPPCILLEREHFFLSLFICCVICLHLHLFDEIKVLDHWFLLHFWDVLVLFLEVNVVASVTAIVRELECVECLLDCGDSKFA